MSIYLKRVAKTKSLFKHPKVSPHSNFQFVETFFCRNNLNLCGSNTIKEIFDPRFSFSSPVEGWLCEENIFQTSREMCVILETCRNIIWRKHTNLTTNLVRKSFTENASLHNHINGFYTANKTLFEIHYPKDLI